MAKIVNKSQRVVSALLKSRQDLENLLFIIKAWKKNGIDGNGVVPFAILPLEEKLQKSIADIDEMLKMATRI